MNVTFGELLRSVFIEIDTFTVEIQQSILQIMNQEMLDSICKCFTDRLSRLINCLSGFSSKINIKISTNEEINNIIITLKNKIADVNELKIAIVYEMESRGYDLDTINQWIIYV